MNWAGKIVVSLVDSGRVYEWRQETPTGDDGGKKHSHFDCDTFKSEGLRIHD